MFTEIELGLIKELIEWYFCDYSGCEDLIEYDEYKQLLEKINQLKRQ
jgi:hypothetical protein